MEKIKLLIELDKDDYKRAIMFPNALNSYYCQAIRNGIPYNPSGDCISREALKGVIETYRPALIYNNKTDMKNRMVDYFLDEIDNAPTVDLWQMRQEAAENALKKAEVLYDRTQGEWIPKRLWDNTHIWVCSECGNQNKHGITVEKACWKCGAEMRGGAE